MADKTIFAAGLIVKPPSENAPDFIKAKLSIKVEELTAFLEEHTKPDGWVNLDVKESKGGKWYAQLNHWSKGDAPKAVEEDVTNAEQPF